MPNNVTMSLQTKIKKAIQSLINIRSESADLVDLYFDEVSSDLSGVSGTTAVTVTTKLTKDEVTTSVTMCQNLENFFTNQSVTTGDYLQTLNSVLNGNDQATSVVSEAVENYGFRVVELSKQVLGVYNDAFIIENLYNASEVSAAVGSISTQTVVFGSDMTKDDLTSAITLLQQWKNFVGNSAVSTGDYQSTLSKWERI